MAEFQYNNHIHSSTQQTPFMLDCGQHPRMGFEPQQPSWVESANEFAGQMKAAMEEAKAALSKAKDDKARYYNQRCLPTPTYTVGDMVYLDTSDIQTTRPSQKLPSQTRPIPNRKAGLLQRISVATTLSDEAPTPGIQCSQAHPLSYRPDSRQTSASPFSSRSRWR